LVEAENNVTDLNANWAINKPILEGNIEAIQGQLENKT